MYALERLKLEKKIFIMNLLEEQEAGVALQTQNLNLKNHSPPQPLMSVVCALRVNPRGTPLSGDTHVFRRGSFQRVKSYTSERRNEKGPDEARRPQSVPGSHAESSPRLK